MNVCNASLKQANVGPQLIKIQWLAHSAWFGIAVLYKEALLLTHSYLLKTCMFCVLCSNIYTTIYCISLASSRTSSMS